jgi:hypothetical protein
MTDTPKQRFVMTKRRWLIVTAIAQMLILAGLVVVVIVAWRAR